MRARELHRIAAVSGSWREAAASVCMSLALLVSTGIAHAQQPNVVTPAEQTARDDERLRILRDELRKSEASLDALARRKAERLAAADMAGADEAEEQRVRALSDIAGLKREIASTSRASPTASRTPSAATTRSAKPTPTRRPPTTPWWDVYGKSRRTEAPGPVSYAAPPGEGGVHGISSRRLE